MSTIVVTITTNEADATQVAVAGQPHRCLRNVENILHAIATGSKLGGVAVQVSASDPVRASGTLTLTYASIANNDTCVIGGVTLTCVTGTPSGYTQFKKQTDATVTAANLVVAINNNTSTSKFCSASSALGVVTITAHAAGTVGNQIATVGSTGIVAGAAVLASGAGGAGTAAASYKG